VFLLVLIVFALAALAQNIFVVLSIVLKFGKISGWFRVRLWGLIMNCLGGCMITTPAGLSLLLQRNTL